MMHFIAYPLYICANSSRCFSLSLHNPFPVSEDPELRQLAFLIAHIQQENTHKPLQRCQKGSACLIKSVCFPVGSCIHYLTVSEASAWVNMINTLPECSHLRGLAFEDYRNKLKAILTVKIEMFSIHYGNVGNFQLINVNMLTFYLRLFSLFLKVL